jgi:alpha-1,2-mannosyltransferase
MVPVALIAGKRWRTAIAAVVTALALCGIAGAILGWSTWLGFINDSVLARTVLGQGAVGDYKMQSLFAAVRLVGGSLTLAYGVQGALTLMVGSVLGWVCWKASYSDSTGAALAAGALLASPSVLAYDLVLLAIPLFWVWQTARRTGFRPWEKVILSMASLMPIIPWRRFIGFASPLPR